MSPYLNVFLKASDAQRGIALVHIASVLFMLVMILGLAFIGRSVLDSALINKQLAQIERYKRATDMFRQKYQALPGDFSNQSGVLALANQPLLGGNADGIIGSVEEERLIFWSHLVAAQLLQDKLDLYESPLAAIGNGFIAVHFAHSNALHYFHIGPALDAQANSFTPLQAYKFDLKSDEGTPRLGSVLAYGAGPWGTFRLPMVAATKGRSMNACITLDTPPEYQSHNDSAALCSLDVAF